MSLQEFYEQRKNKNNHVFFTDNSLKSCQFMYRDNKYKYNQLVNPQILSLSISKFYDKEKELFIPHELKDEYSIRLMETLDRYINKARFESIKASTILDNFGYRFFKCRL